MIEPFEAPDQRRGVEVQQKPRWATTEFEVSNHLGLVNRVQTLHGFQFDHDALLDQEVDDELAANAWPL